MRRHAVSEVPGTAAWALGFLCQHPEAVAEAVKLGAVECMVGLLQIEAHMTENEQHLALKQAQHAAFALRVLLEGGGRDGVRRCESVDGSLLPLHPRHALYMHTHTLTHSLTHLPSPFQSASAKAHGEKAGKHALLAQCSALLLGSHAHAALYMLPCARGCLEELNLARLLGARACKRDCLLRASPCSSQLTRVSIGW